MAAVMLLFSSWSFFMLQIDGFVLQMDFVCCMWMSFVAGSISYQIHRVTGPHGVHVPLAAALWRETGRGS